MRAAEPSAYLELSTITLMPSATNSTPDQKSLGLRIDIVQRSGKRSMAEARTVAAVPRVAQDSIAVTGDGRKKSRQTRLLVQLRVSADQMPFFARRSLKYLSSHCACSRCCSCGFTSS